MSKALTPTFTILNGQMDRFFQRQKECKTTLPFSAMPKPSEKTQASSQSPKRVQHCAVTENRIWRLTSSAQPTLRYRAKVFDYLDSLSKQDILGVTLNLYHFADQEYCTCPRCTEQRKKSGLDWTEWRAQTVTAFLKEAKTHTKGTFAVEMYPDPVLAKERFGLDFNAIAELVDYFHVPLSSRDYFTNYWVDTDSSRLRCNAQEACCGGVER